MLSELYNSKTSLFVADGLPTDTSRSLYTTFCSTSNAMKPTLIMSRPTASTVIFHHHNPADRNLALGVQTTSHYAQLLFLTSRLARSFLAARRPQVLVHSSALYYLIILISCSDSLDIGWSIHCLINLYLPFHYTH